MWRIVSYVVNYYIIHCVIAMATVKINGYTHNENTLDKEFDKEGQKCS